MVSAKTRRSDAMEYHAVWGVMIVFGAAEIGEACCSRAHPGNRILA